MTAALTRRAESDAQHDRYFNHWRPLWAETDARRHREHVARQIIAYRARVAMIERTAPGTDWLERTRYTLARYEAELGA